MFFSSLRQAYLMIIAGIIFDIASAAVAAHARAGAKREEKGRTIWSNMTGSLLLLPFLPTLFLLLPAFATGCSAMTGVEAISNGIPAFQQPQTRNAATTLTWMALILGTLFLVIRVLAMTYHVEASAASDRDCSDCAAGV